MQNDIISRFNIFLKIDQTSQVIKKTINKIK